MPTFNGPSPQPPVYIPPDGDFIDTTGDPNFLFILELDPATGQLVVKSIEKKGLTSILVSAGAIVKQGFQRGVVFGGTAAEGFISMGHGNPPAIPPGLVREVINNFALYYPQVLLPPMWQADP